MDTAMRNSITVVTGAAVEKLIARKCLKNRGAPAPYKRHSCTRYTFLVTGF